MQIDLPQQCDHQPVWVGQVAVAACSTCGTVEWLSAQGGLDPAEAMAALFGSYDLLGPLDAIRSPGPWVLAYVPPSARKRKNMDALPKGVWLQAGPRIWMSHDGEVLLLSTDDRLLYENVMAGAGL